MEPAVLISFVVTGNAFPVTEHHSKPGSFVGHVNVFTSSPIYPSSIITSPFILANICSQPLQSGCNSHYVIVKRTGEVPETTDENSELFDEIVINQESQICPAYMLKLTPDKTKKLLNSWNRTKPKQNSSTQYNDDLYVPLTEM